MLFNNVTYDLDHCILLDIIKQCESSDQEDFPTEVDKIAR